MRNATDAMRESRVPDILNAVGHLLLWWFVTVLLKTWFGLVVEGPVVL